MKLTVVWGWRDPDRANNVDNEKRQGWRDPDRAVAITTVPGSNTLGQIAAREAAPQVELPPSNLSKRKLTSLKQGPGGGFISIEIPPASEGCLLGMNCPGDPNYPGKKLAREAAPQVRSPLPQPQPPNSKY